jgi:hypothetical protein
VHALFSLLASGKSISFFIKYMQVPMTTIVTLERLNVEHMPWITVCPNPGVSFTRLEEYFGDRGVVKNPGDKPEARVPMGYTLLGLTPDELEAVFSQTNDTINDLLRNVSLPLWALTTECAVKGGGVHQRSCMMTKTANNGLD